MENYIAIIIASISAAVSIGSFVIKLVYDAHKYKLEVLMAAFQDEKNDKRSRIDAWKKYKKAGGHNYINTLRDLEKLE